MKLTKSDIQTLRYGLHALQKQLTDKMEKEKEKEIRFDEKHFKELIEKFESVTPIFKKLNDIEKEVENEIDQT